MTKKIQKIASVFFVFTLLFTLGIVCFPSQAAAAASKTQPHPAPPKTIFNFKSQLHLTNTQISKMKKDLQDFQKRLIMDRAKFQLTALKLQSLVKKQAPIPEIKAKLEKEAELQIDMKLADIETARGIEGVLSPVQLKKWREIQKKNQSSR